jgi:hypothetical protein
VPPQVIKKALADNQACKGKVQALEQLRGGVLALAAQDEGFGPGAAAYQAHVAQAAASAAAASER